MRGQRYGAGGYQIYSADSFVLLKRDYFSGCVESNLYQFPVDLVDSTISWDYSCPHGYTPAGTDTDGALMCRRPLVHEPCVCGNPITHASEKIQPELDYRSADGMLELMRTYSSSRYPEPGWTTRFDTRVQFGQSYAAVVRPDGSRLFFEFNGRTFKSIQPTKATLALNPNGFTFTTDTDVKEIYNGAGFLTALVYRDGKTVSIERVLETDIAGVLTVTDAYGRKLALRYEALNSGEELYLRKAFLPDGAQFEFQSNVLTGMFVHVIRENYLRAYDYDATRLTGITDENGKRYAEFGYRFNTTSTKHLGDVDAFTVYDNRQGNGGGTVVVTEPLGVDTVYNYATVNGLSRLVSMTRGSQGTTTMSYDANGNIASLIDFNGNFPAPCPGMWKN